jgi:hypothetical protein
MTDPKFLEIWNNGIKPLLDWETNKDKDKRIYATYDTSIVSEAPHNMKSRYETLRDGVKKNFMQQINGLLDRHKICACIYVAIIGRPLLKVANGNTEKDRLVNAKVAFIASCRILLAFMLDDAKAADVGFQNFLKTLKILCFPKCKNSDSKESYLIQTIKGLCHAQECDELSIIMLANIFCAIESNTELSYVK